jgi:hypothetical protein
VNVVDLDVVVEAADVAVTEVVVAVEVVKKSKVGSL